MFSRRNLRTSSQLQLRAAAQAFSQLTLHLHPFPPLHCQKQRAAFGVPVLPGITCSSNAVSPLWTGKARSCVSFLKNDGSRNISHWTMATTITI